MARPMLRGRMQRYHEEGVAGLRPRVIPGRPGALTAERMEELRTMVLQRPDPERDRVGH